MTSVFKFNGEILELLWYLEFFPKANSDEGTCRIVLRVEAMPKAKSMDIVSVTISQVTDLDLIGLRSNGTNVHDTNRDFMGYYVISCS